MNHYYGMVGTTKKRSGSSDSSPKNKSAQKK